MGDLPSASGDLRAAALAVLREHGQGSLGLPNPFADKEPARGHDLFGLGERDRQAVLAWVGENLPAVRRSVYDQRLLHWSLGIGFVVADLLYALGYALWTGVVVAVFVQVFPEAKRRQFKQALDAYEAGLREKGRAGGD